MADPTTVQPGDLITADLWNALVQKVNSLTGAPVSGNTISVPSVFGMNLSDAKTALTLPGLQLSLSQVIDAFGLSVNASDTANAQRRVISQVPAGGAMVPPGTGVSLVVAAVATGGGGTGTAPTIGTLPASAAASAFITIVGTNFDSPATNNTVTFDGVQGAVQSGTTLALQVQVPLNIPGVPATGGSKAGVRVMVTNHFGQASNSLTMTVNSPPARVLNIASLTPSETTLGSAVTIRGTGFGTDPNAIKVLFDAGTPTGPSTVSDTQLQVTVPATLPRGAPGTTRTFQVSLQATGVVTPSNNSPLIIDF